MEESKIYIFNLINVSKSNSITSLELYNFLILIEPDITLNDVNNMITRYDTTSTNTLNYADFSTAMGNIFTTNDINIAYESIFNSTELSLNKLQLYFNVLELTPFYNLPELQYLNIINEMAGNDINDFTNLLTFLNILFV
jgi:hypothetical protein